MNLTKSLYRKGMMCQKLLWLTEHKKEVLSSLDDVQKENTKKEKSFSDLACEVFPYGVSIPFDVTSYEMIDLTKKYIDNNMKTIYDATFNYEGILISIDILIINDDGVDIYEVKGRKKRDDMYMHDLSIAYYTLVQLGFKVKNAFVMHLSDGYNSTLELDLDETFDRENITDDIILLQKDVPSSIRRFEVILDEDIPEPYINLEKKCHDKQGCVASSYCWRNFL